MNASDIFAKNRGGPGFRPIEKRLIRGCSHGIGDGVGIAGHLKCNDTVGNAGFSTNNYTNITAGISINKVNVISKIKKLLI